MGSANNSFTGSTVPKVPTVPTLMKLKTSMFVSTSLGIIAIRVKTAILSMITMTRRTQFVFSYLPNRWFAQKKPVISSMLSRDVQTMTWDSAAWVMIALGFISRLKSVRIICMASVLKVLHASSNIPRVSFLKKMQRISRVTGRCH